MQLRYRQTEFDANKGNALQACVATIFQESSLEAVPNFIAQPDLYASLTAHLASKGYAFIKIMLNELGEVPAEVAQVYSLGGGGNGIRCLVAGYSPRSKMLPLAQQHKHVVVGQLSRERGIEMMFDPHPSDDYLFGAPLWLGLFVRQ